MSKKKTAKTKLSPTKYIFLIIGGALLLVVLISWLAFPAWHAQPGGFWLLIVAAAGGIISIIKDVLTIFKDIKETNAPEPKPADPKPAVSQVQEAINSSDVDQSMTGNGSNQKQTAKDSQNVSQSMTGNGGNQKQTAKDSQGVKQSIK
jgi:hypothetical protein